MVAESGFGTGLNFLTLWQAFDVFHRDNPEATLQRLHFISFEKFPLKAEDLRLAHQRWPELATWAEQLQAQWPLPIAGCHRLLLAEGRITLDLWFGDVNARHVPVFILRSSAKPSGLRGVVASRSTPAPVSRRR